MPEKEIKGQLNFQNCDPLTCRFEMEPNEKIQSNIRLNLVRDLLPADYEPELYDVTGEYAFKVKVTKKKK